MQVASREVNDNRKHERVGGQVSVSLRSAANGDSAEKIRCIITSAHCMLGRGPCINKQDRF